MEEKKPWNHYLLNEFVLENPEYLNRIPQKEQDIYELHFLRGLNQKEIAQCLGITQGAISSRLKKAHKRLIFLKELEKYDVKDIENNLKKYFNVFEITLLKTLMETTCQTDTANLLNELFEGNLTQVKVRHHFHKCLNILRTKSPKYYKLFSYIKKNISILHEVRLPQHQK